ncbi:MAG: GNAT family protein [Xanthomonadales bacterium]|nr:GNAT family protein [Xanthomonadales bacterium]
MDLSSIPRTFSTRDLHLRPSNDTDAESMFTMLSDPQSMKYWSDEPISNLEAAVEVLNKDLESDAQGNSMCWAVTLKGHDKMIGKCILFQLSQQNRRAEIGYLLNREYWRQGLMHQALEAVIDFAFNTLDFHRIEADVDTENTGSLGLLEKLGFTREGLFRERWFVYDEWQDSVMLGLLKQDWHSRKTSVAEK